LKRCGRLLYPAGWTAARKGGHGQVEQLLQPMQGLERPATAFLSYAREDAKEVGSLQRLLYLRGVRA